MPLRVRGGVALGGIYAHLVHRVPADFTPGAFPPTLRDALPTTPEPLRSAGAKWGIGAEQMLRLTLPAAIERTSGAPSWGGELAGFAAE